VCTQSGILRYRKRLLNPVYTAVTFWWRIAALLNTCISNVVYVVVAVVVVIVIIIIIIIILHELDLNGPVSASSDRLLKRLLGHLCPFVYNST